MASTKVRSRGNMIKNFGSFGNSMKIAFKSLFLNDIIDNKTAEQFHGTVEKIQAQDAAREYNKRKSNASSGRSGKIQNIEVQSVYRNDLNKNDRSDTTGRGER